MVECLVPLLSVVDFLKSWITITLKGEVEGLYIDEFGVKSHVDIIRATVRLQVCSADGGLDSLIESYGC